MPSGAEFGKPDPDEDILLKDAANRPELQFTMVTKSDNIVEKPSEDENMRRSRERLENLKSLGLKIKSPAPVSDLENIPAFRRRNVKFETVSPSSESIVSRYTLSENPDDKKIEIRANNSFLHDNVD